MKLKDVEARLGKKKYQELMSEFAVMGPRTEDWQRDIAEYMKRLRKKYPELSEGEVSMITFGEEP